MPDEVAEAWADYADKLDKLSKQLKLVAFWMAECSAACNEAAYQTKETADQVRAYLSKPKY